MRHCSIHRSALAAMSVLLVSVVPARAVPVGKSFVCKAVGDRELKVHFVFPAN